MAATNLKRSDSVSSIQLLIVDQHPSVRRALAERLATADPIHAIFTASSLGEAAAIIEKRHPDAVLLGLRAQPEVRDVQEISDLAQQLSAWGGALLILATYSVDDERKAILRAGARRYLLKGIDTDHLLDEIESSVHETTTYAKKPRKGSQIPDGSLPEEI